MFSIVGKKSGPGVYISEVVKGGAADVDGRLVQVKTYSSLISFLTFLFTRFLWKLYPNDDTIA